MQLLLACRFAATGYPVPGCGGQDSLWLDVDYNGGMSLPSALESGLSTGADAVVATPPSTLPISARSITHTGRFRAGDDLRQGRRTNILRIIALSRCLQLSYESPHMILRSLPQISIDQLQIFIVCRPNCLFQIMDVKILYCGTHLQCGFKRAFPLLYQIAIQSLQAFILKNAYRVVCRWIRQFISIQK